MRNYPELSFYPRITRIVNPESLVDLNALIVQIPPQGDWAYYGIFDCDFPEKFLKQRGYDPEKVKFVPVYEKPMLRGDVPVGPAKLRRFLMFENIGDKVAELEKGFKDKCGL
ncbi:MAG: hypothetical protein KJ955_08240 [Nanoarchaeota archaeon]|nr:hypothetical protein [Nanoarchaeota archaeon]